MRTSHPNTRPNHGSIILAIVALVAIIVIAYLAYKIIDRLMRHPFDPNHGVGTNITDSAWSGQVENLRQQGVTEAQISVGNETLTVPVDALSYQWHYTVQTSTNLTDWTEVDREMPGVSEMQTNHAEPMRFWRKQIWW